ncbi:MAG: hypothetical protein MK171_03160 [Pirellulales bacterium]|nr:hypothetical protein [Pirellulales bacterium]
MPIIQIEESRQWWQKRAVPGTADVPGSTSSLAAEAWIAQPVAATSLAPVAILVTHTADWLAPEG